MLAAVMAQLLQLGSATPLPIPNCRVASGFSLVSPIPTLNCVARNCPRHADPDPLPVLPLQGRFWLLAGFANPDSELYGEELRAARDATPDRFRLDIALSLTQKNQRGGQEYVQVRPWVVMVGGWMSVYGGVVEEPVRKAGDVQVHLWVHRGVVGWAGQLQARAP